MRRLDRPVRSAKDAFSVCISRIRDPALRGRLRAATQSIVDASNAYELAGEAQALHQIIREDIINNNVTAAEMGAVYTSRMVKRGAPGRDIYDEIFTAAKGRCPLCGHQAVMTLDHLLPKAHYPALAVAPINLVPSCFDCNKAKLSSVPIEPEDVLIHPYFDDVDSDRWLFAEVVRTTPAALRYRVEAPPNWNGVLAERLRRHFLALNLSELYGAQAAEELVNIRYLLRNIHAASGGDGVCAHLEERAQSCIAGRLNGWRGAAYEAWAESHWFCGGGFAPEG